ncbi:NAD(P)H-flavin reductase [Zooshikella ganghwensis]|uniref:NAD(P)H-flavin reductase n=1 Tax=Zooshikella ganghwensis TaxID=202772 RepID=A0A4P9VGT4_9GAMM|nr:NAD(P)H-flavin reductase [Zooshikella ganghwensis]RDH42303.1 NAD(P)H-flavin reductase [Zooshikella ganghwensis]
MTTKTLAVNIYSIDRLPNDIFRVRLQQTTEQLPSFYAGQYLIVQLPNQQQCPLSIASAPEHYHNHDYQLELHIQYLPNSELSKQVIEYIQQQKTLSITLPLGNCHLATIPNKPLVFIAAGTGFAQMKSMLEHCFAQKHPYPLHLYWGARLSEQFYLKALPQQWAKENKIVFHPVVSDSAIEDEVYRSGLLIEAVHEDLASIKDAFFYISGSPTMVYATFDGLISEGIAADHVAADVFDYAPRKK